MILVVNLKTYKKSTGRNALKLAKSLPDNIIIAAQTGDIKMLSGGKKHVYSQHADFQIQGRNTGYTIIEDLISQGAEGTLLNHSEHKLSFLILKKTLKRCKEKNFKTIVCVASLNEARKILSLNPDLIAFEVPELISTGKSISSVMPKKVKSFSDLVKNYNKRHRTGIKALCGAGISTKEDAKVSKSLGCNGVLVASAIVNAKNPGKLAQEMLNA